MAQGSPQKPNTSSANWIRRLDLPSLQSRSPSAVLYDRGRKLAIARRQVLFRHHFLSGDALGQTESIDRIQFDGAIVGLAAGGDAGIIVTRRVQQKTLIEFIDNGRRNASITVPNTTQEAVVFGDFVAIKVGATESSPPQLWVWDIGSGKLRYRVDLPSPATSVHAARDPNRLILSDRTRGRTWIIDTNSSVLGNGFDGDVAIDIPDGIVVGAPNGRLMHKRAGSGPSCAAQLDFRPAALYAAGTFLLALDRNHRRMALLDSKNLEILVFHQFGFRGATVLTDPASEPIVWYDWSRAAWETFDIGRFLEEAALGPRRARGDGREAVTFVGGAAMPLLNGHAPTIGTLKTLVLPLLEAGQTIAPGDVARLHAFLNAEVFPVLARYYGETSYGLLSTSFDMLGVEFRPGDQPLRLSRPFNEYFHGDVTPGGFKTVVEEFADPHEVIFEGNETLRLRVIDPEFTGPTGVDVDVPFAAFSLTRTFSADATLSFSGEEVALLASPPVSVQRLRFPPRSISISVADPAPGLRALEDYLNSVLNAAALADESLRLSARARRIPTSSGEFGELHVDFFFAGVPRGERFIFRADGDVPALDFSTAKNAWFRFHPGGVFNDALPLQEALGRALLHAQVDANLGEPGARPFSNPDVFFSDFSGQLETVLALAPGLSAGRSLSLLSQAGLESIGFNGERPSGTRIAASVLIDRSYQVAFEGSEEASVEISPGGGISPFNVDVRFHCSAGVTGQPSRPETISFDDNEIALTATDDSGATRLLRISFPTNSFPLRAGNLRADLAALEAFIDGRIAAAERDAGLTDRLLWFRLAEVQVAGVARLVSYTGYRNRVSIPTRRLSFSVLNDTSLALFALGFRAMQSFSDNLYASAARDALEDYLERVVGLAAYDAERAADDPVFARPEVSIDPSRNRLEIFFPLAGRSAGRRASARVLSQTGLERIGFDRSTPVTASVIAIDDRFTVRQFTRGSAVAGDEDAPVLGDEIISALFDRVPDAEARALRDQIHANYETVMLLIVGPAPTTIGGRAVPAEQRWTTSAISVTEFIREFAAPESTVRHIDGHPEKQLTRTFFLAMTTGEDVIATMAHEMGHVIGFYDLYTLESHRDNLEYMEHRSIMGDQRTFPHVDGFHKEAAGWLDDDPDPTPVEGASEEMILIAHERWDAGIAETARAAFGLDTIAVRPLMRCSLGGDGAQTLLIEARQRGNEFSQGLPATGRVLVTNVIDHADTNRYPVRSGYRRHVHLLAELDEGESADLGTLSDLAVGGTVVSVLGRREVASPEGPILAFHVRVVREPAEIIDLYFHGTTPPWRSSDLWVDHPVGDRTIHPVGSAIEQGDVVRVPASGIEPHDVVARIWNRGSVEARDVRVRFLVCNPAGAGDRGNFVEFDNIIVPAVAPDSENPDGTLAVGTWQVPSEAGRHQCLIAEIADWSLPPRAPGAPPVRDDFATNNHSAQQNITRFEALHGSPFEPIEFDYSVANDGSREERVRLQPENLPEGMRLTVNPAGQTIAPKDVKLFHCRLELDAQALQVGCTSDRHFLIVARRDERVTEERWGAVKYVIQPRQRTNITVEAGWSYGPLWVTGEVQPHPLGDRVRLRLLIGGQPVHWHTISMRGGHFEWRSTPRPPEGAGGGARITIYYDGDQVYASAVSPEIEVPYVELI